MIKRNNIQTGIYLSKNGIVLRFPVNPSEISISHDTDNKKYNVLDVGEIVVPRLPKLTSISWKSFFPANADAPYVLTYGNFKSPSYYINKITSYIKAREPVRLIINRFDDLGTSIFDTNMLVIISDFKTTEKGGETGDFYYQIGFDEYRDYKPQTVDVQLITQTDNASGTSTETARVVSTDQRTTEAIPYVGAQITFTGSVYSDPYIGAPLKSYQTNCEAYIVRNENPAGEPDEDIKYPYLVSTTNSISADSVIGYISRYAITHVNGQYLGSDGDGTDGSEAPRNVVTPESNTAGAINAANIGLNSTLITFEEAITAYEGDGSDLRINK